MLATGFAPLARADARLLILGSLPGQASLSQQQYYAHPHNTFWRLVGTLFQFPYDSPYQQRCLAALEAGLAIWDVCHSAQRTGSLDSAISSDSVRANDISGLLEQCPHIHTIAFNGQTAARLFTQRISPSRTVKLVTLPSSSPAHASVSYAQKLQVWRQLLVG